MTRSGMIHSVFLLAAFGALVAPAAAQSVEAQAPAAATPASAKPISAAKLRLKSDLTLMRDIVSFGDLIEGLSPQDAAIPAFRAPALGETGTIQVERIVEAGLKNALLRNAHDLDAQGAAQVVVTRAARRIGAADIDLAVKVALIERYGFDARAYSLVLDGGAPAVAVEPELTGDMVATDLNYDAHSRRITGRFAVPGSAATRLRPVRVTGQLIETVEVVVPLRPIARGETLTASDVAVERRPRGAQGSDLLGEMTGAVGKVARRALLAGVAIRGGDVQRQEIVARGEIVSILYESPGIQISMRGRANEAGALGDTISITNPQSKRVLQGTITGHGRVNVAPAGGGRVAVAR